MLSVARSAVTPGRGREERGQLGRQPRSEIVHGAVAAEIGERKDGDARRHRTPVGATWRRPPIARAPRAQSPQRPQGQSAPAHERPMRASGLRWAHSGWRSLLHFQRFRLLRRGGPSGLAVELVAISRHGHDQPRRPGIELKFAPKPADQDVDAAVERLKRPVGGRVQDGVPKSYTPRPGRVTKRRNSANSLRVREISSPDYHVRVQAARSRTIPANWGPRPRTSSCRFGLASRGFQSSCMDARQLQPRRHYSRNRQHLQGRNIAEMRRSTSPLHAFSRRSRASAGSKRKERDNEGACSRCGEPRRAIIDGRRGRPSDQQVAPRQPYDRRRVRLSRHGRAQRL